MGDRTYHQITFYACPAEHVRAVLNVLDEQGYGVDTEDKEAGRLALADTYEASEEYVGHTEETVSKLLAIADGEVALAFSAHEAGCYGSAGVIHRHTPELGTFAATYDGGEPVFTASETRRILAAPEEERATLLGEAHYDEIHRLGTLLENAQKAGVDTDVRAPAEPEVEADDDDEVPSPEAPAVVAAALDAAPNLHAALRVVIENHDRHAAYWRGQAGDEPATFDEVEADGAMTAHEEAADALRSVLDRFPDPCLIVFPAGTPLDQKCPRCSGEAGDHPAPMTGPGDERPVSERPTLREV